MFLLTPCNFYSFRLNEKRPSPLSKTPAFPGHQHTEMHKKSQWSELLLGLRDNFAHEKRRWGETKRTPSLL